MRDIRSDLKERVEDIDLQIKDLDDQMATLKAHRESILELLRKEEQLFFKTKQSSLFSSPDTEVVRNNLLLGGNSLIDVLMDILGEGRSLTLDEIAASANKVYPFGSKSAKRVINTTLLGMRSGNRVDRLPDGRWKARTA